MSVDAASIDDCLSQITQSAILEGDKPKMMIGKDIARYLQNLIVQRGAKHILEIGTYLGYSAISFAAASKAVQVTTLEVGEMRYQRAQKWIQSSGLADQIQALCIDGLYYLKEVDVAKQFDFIFLDAQKRKSFTYVELALKRLAKGGMIVIDDVLCPGEPGHPKFKAKQEYMADFITQMQENPNYKTTLVPLRHGLLCIEMLADL